MSQLKDIPLSQIQEPANKLRPVLKETEEYQGMVDSIKQMGILNAIVVRQIENLQNPDEEKYEVIEGNHRFNASIDAGKESIPAQIMDLDDEDIYDAQIIGNVQKVETKPVEYSKQLKGIIQRNRALTAPELATRLGKSLSWLQARLSLADLLPEIGMLVDGGQITLSNAYKLADLDTDDQMEFKDRAMTEGGDTFYPAVAQHIKQKKEAIRQGLDPNIVKKYVPNAHGRSMKDLKDALTNDTLSKVIAESNAGTPSEAALATIKWVLHLNPEELAKGQAKWDADVKEKADKASKRKEEAATKKAKTDAEAAMVVK